MDVTIDGSMIKSEADIHAVLREKLDFGPYYGNNLAALRDRLSNDVERPINLVWENARLSRTALGDELFESIVGIFRWVESQDEKFGWDDRFVFRMR